MKHGKFGKRMGENQFFGMMNTEMKFIIDPKKVTLLTVRKKLDK